MRHELCITKREIDGSPIDELKRGTIRLRAEWPDIASLDFEAGILMKKYQASEFAEELETILLDTMDKIAEAWTRTMTERGKADAKD